MKGGDYKILRLIGKGGMGEVYLAYDPHSDRKVALKRIREDLASNSFLRKRFLREPRITGRLVHPGIVSVYTIQGDIDPVYYTMPYIEGYTLKSLLKSVWGQEVLSEDLKEKTSISAFVPIFHSVCSTIEYAHSQGILHRDLKPDNILIGMFDEVVILDWGAAIAKDNRWGLEFAEDFQDVLEQDFIFQDKIGPSEGITMPGNIVGTLDYMAPERLLGYSATEATDIYALGVILYQMLTLSFPFAKRKKGRLPKSPEHIFPPEVIAPYREISPALSQIVMKALDADPDKRYGSVKELRADISSYLSGKPSWSEKESVHLTDRCAWRFSEHLLPSKYFADVDIPSSLWYTVKVSDRSWFSDIRIECRFLAEGLQAGVGILFPVFLGECGKSFFEGYGFWLTYRHGLLKASLVRSGIALETKSVLVEGLENLFVVMEKERNKITFNVGDVMTFRHVDTVPERGGRVGFIFYDKESLGQEISIFESSSSLLVSCLSIPDAFLSEKMFDQALESYRRIAISFPGRREGCEARFRAGMTLLEKGLSFGYGDLFSKYLLLALDEFSLLHLTPLAPLEYLGKSLVYKAYGDCEEEVRCLALGVKRYKKHHEVDRVHKQVLYRLHEVIHKDEGYAPLFMLLLLDTNPEGVAEEEGLRFLTLLKPKILVTSFCLYGKSPPRSFHSTDTILLLGYWTGFSLPLFDLLDKERASKDFNKGLVATIFFILSSVSPMEFSCYLERCIPWIGEGHVLLRFGYLLDAITTDFAMIDTFLGDLRVDFPEILLGYLIERFLFEAPMMGKELSGLRVINAVKERYCKGELFVFKNLNNKQNEPSWLDDDKIVDIGFLIDCEKIRLLLFLGDHIESGKLLYSYGVERLLDDSTELFLLYGCWLALTEGEEIARLHFAGVSEDCYPCPNMMLAYTLATGTRVSFDRLLYGEKRKVLHQQILYFRCLGEREREQEALRAYREL